LRQELSFATKLPPKKPHHVTRRSREYFTAEKVDLLIRTAHRQGRSGQRHATLILLRYRHVLRVAEVVRLQWAAGFAFPVHPHMLRHACGFYLANNGVDTRALQQDLGHRNIQHTVRYTELTPQRFQNFWED
jgi:site-specific recombinase XerD